MIRRLHFIKLILPVVLFFQLIATGQTALNTGDIAVFHVQTDITDTFKFVTFVDIDPGTVIYFTSVGVSNTGFFQLGNTNINDGTFAYTVPPAGLNAGEIITWVLGAGSANFSVYTDNISTRTTERNFSSGGDQVIVFQNASSATGGVNSLSNPKFISVTHTASTQFGGDPTDTNDTFLPDGLSITSPITALRLGVGPNPSDETDNIVYTGLYAFSNVTDAKASFFNVSNYHKTNDQTSDGTYTTAVGNIPAGGVTLTPLNSAPTAAAPTAPTVSEDATNVALANNIQVTDADGDDQTVTFTVTGGTVALGTSGITFGGSGNGSASFTALGTLAAINTALDAATFTPTANLNGTNAGVISFTTNDGTDTSSPASVTFDITAVNDEPSFVKGANEDVNEDAGAQTINSWATSLEDGDTELTQTLSFNVSNDNGALFSAEPAINASGHLTYTPAAGVSGAATVTVSIMDNGGTANGGDDTSADQTFTITVNAINDKPSFVKGANEAVNEDAGAQTINSWATSLEDGDAEVVQTLSFNVSNDNGALFSAEPAIDASGNLTYTPATDAFGVATVTVSIMDNGGTSNPGDDDTSPDQTFTITVNQINDTTPVITSITDDAGVSSSDYITNDNRPVINGTAEPGSTVSFFFNGGDSYDTVGAGATTVANGSGQFSYEIPETLTVPVVGTVTLLPLPEGTASFQVVSRVNGLQVLTSASQSVTIDTVDPTVVISSTESSPTGTTPIAVTVTFSQEVTDFTEADLIETNGTISDFTTSDNTVFTFNITPVANGNVTVDINTASAQDIAGNDNEVATQFLIVYDMTLSVNNFGNDTAKISIINPVQNTLMAIGNVEVDNIQVYSLSGTLVASSKNNSVDVSMLTSGIYITKIATKSGSVKTLKIAKE